MKWLIFGLIVLFTIYAPIELTRVILEYGSDGELVSELMFMWGLYVLGMLILKTSGRLLI